MPYWHMPKASFSVEMPPHLPAAPSLVTALCAKSIPGSTLAFAGLVQGNLVVKRTGR